MERVKEKNGFSNIIKPATNCYERLLKKCSINYLLCVSNFCLVEIWDSSDEVVKDKKMNKI